MDLFVIDTCPNQDLYQSGSENEAEETQTGDILVETDEDEDYGGLPPPSKDISHIIKGLKGQEKGSNSDKIDISEIIRMKKEAKSKERVSKKTKTPFKAPVVESCLDEIIQTNLKSSITNTPPVISNEKLHTVTMSDRKLLKLRRLENAKTKGKEWFNLPAPEVTEEVKNELELIRMRSVLDNKHFYKRAESKVLPKYFQIGKILPSPLDHYSERHEGKKSRAKTLVDELLADAEFQRKNKRKYREIIESKKSAGYYKASQKMKKLKKRK